MNLKRQGKRGENTHYFRNKFHLPYIGFPGPAAHGRGHVADRPGATSPKCISTSKKVPEGPMGEYHGYMLNDQPAPEPLFLVDCVTCSDHPVVPICVAGQVADETHTVWGPAISAELLATLREAGFPAGFVWMPFEAQRCCVVVSVNINTLVHMNITAEELYCRAGDIIFKTHANWEVPKGFLVSDDIDITDVHQLLWAIATRYRPGADEYVFGGVAGIPMIPYMTRASKLQVLDPGKRWRSVVNLLLPSEFEGKRTWVPSNFEDSHLVDGK